MECAVTINVNGRPLHGRVEPRLLLVHFLRDAGLTGTKVGCDTSQCGSCTVLVDGVAVKSCTTLAVQVDGARVTTIEGLADHGQLTALQDAFWATHGLQCGFCTPGFLMLAANALEHNPNIGDDELLDVLSSNLCRCTGYQNIIKAVRAARDTIRGAKA